MTSPPRLPKNLFCEPADLPTDELTELIQQAGPVRIERIVSTGQSSPDGFWYDQDEDEWVCVLRGAARLEFEEPRREISLAAGDHVFIKAHDRHRVQWTAPDQPTIWLAVFMNRK